MNTSTKDLIPVLQKEISPIVAQAEKLEIATPRDMEHAAEMLSQLNKRGDSIEAEREKVTVPLNQALKAERARWKPLEIAIETTVSIIRSKMSVYQTAQTRVANEEAARIASRVGDGRGKLRPETAINKIAAIDTPSQNVEATSGSVKFRTDKVLRLTHPIATIHWLVKANKFDLLSIDETKLKKLIIEGALVDGAEIEEIQTPINSR